MDFTLKTYSILLNHFIKNDFNFISFNDYCNGVRFNKMIILRHDVDLKPQNSINTAIIEAQLGIHSSYYFRIKKDKWEEKEIDKIALEAGWLE